MQTLERKQEEKILYRTVTSIYRIECALNFVICTILKTNTTNRSPLDTNSTANEKCRMKTYFSWLSCHLWLVKTLLSSFDSLSYTIIEFCAGIFNLPRKVAYLLNAITGKG
jgi:hypothetical protein